MLYVVVVVVSRVNFSTLHGFRNTAQCVWLCHRLQRPPSFLEFLLYLNAKKSRQGKVSTQSYPNPAKQFGKFLLRASQPLIFSLELLLPKEVSDI